tara:strand:+ start:1351 stop:1827 length:477 start_codon:yes stop_codon:yes gene_type:complete
MTEISKFNGLLQEFLDKMVNKFNSDKLKSYRKAFMMIKITKPESPVNLFMVSCVDYKHKIISRDEQFFLNSSDIKNKANNFGNFTDECGLSYYWNTLDEVSKTAIWDYIQSLFVLGEIIVNKNKALFDRYNKLYIDDYKNEVDSIKSNSFSASFLEKI